MSTTITDSHRGILKFLKYIIQFYNYYILLYKRKYPLKSYIIIKK